MKKLFMLFCLFTTILNAQLKLTTVISNRKQPHQNIKPFQPQFLILEQNKNSISYQIQGFVSSSGLHKKSLKKIKTEKQIHQKTLDIKHFILTKNGFGKEGVHIIGYNFQQYKQVKIPKSINNIIITLYNDNQRIIATDTLQLNEF